MGSLFPGWAPATSRAGEDLPPPRKTSPSPGPSIARPNLQLPESGIREQLLELTPKGSSLDTVTALLARWLHREHPLPLGAGPARVSVYSDRAGDADARKKRLVVFLGYRHRGIEISSRQGVTAFYAFDAQDRLADVYIVRQEEPF